MTRIHDQTRIDSIMEAVVNTAIGFVITMIAWHWVAGLFSIPMPMSRNLLITSIFTVISIVRQYVLRRIFDGRSPWLALKGIWA